MRAWNSSLFMGMEAARVMELPRYVGKARGRVAGGLSGKFVAQCSASNEICSPPSTIDANPTNPTSLLPSLEPCTQENSTIREPLILEWPQA